MKYGIVGVCVWVMIAYVAAGQEATIRSEPVTISYWGEEVDIQQAVYDEWIADFQEAYPWITVEYQRFENEVWEDSLRAGMFSEAPPDIFDIETRVELQEYVQAGLVYDLTEWYTAHQDRFIPGYESNAKINGRYYGIPWTAHIMDLIWYNPQKLAQYEIDPQSLTTWDDVMAACETLKQHGEVPFAFGGGGLGWTGAHWVMFLIQKNLSMEAILQLSRREKTWTDPDVVAALSHFEECVKKGYFAPQAAVHERDEGRALYFQGQGAFWQAGSWHLYQKGSEAVPADWEFVFIPFPNFAGAPVQDIAITVNTMQWALHHNSPHLEESLLFLEYITRRTSAELWVNTAHGFVTVRDAVNEQTAGPEMIAIAEYVESANVVTDLGFFFPREVVQDGWQAAKEVLAGDMTTQEWARFIDELHKAAGPISLE